MSHLTDTIFELRKLLTQLEAYTERPATLDLQIQNVLADAGNLSTSGVARLIHRRRRNVLATLRLMYDAGRVGRRDGRRTADVTSREPLPQIYEYPPEETGSIAPM